MYILQKKDKPRTAVQSIGPQTKLVNTTEKYPQAKYQICVY